MEIPFSPHTPYPKQEAFILDDSFEAIWSASVSTGKSDAMLMSALLHVGEPGYNALIIRETHDCLLIPGGIVDRFVGWIAPHLEVEWDAHRLRATFPSGATLTFSYWEGVRDTVPWHSSEYDFVGFDDVSNLPEWIYNKTFTRVRHHSPENRDLPLRMRVTTGALPRWMFDHFRLGRGTVFLGGLDEFPLIDAEVYREALDRLGPLIREQLTRDDWEAWERQNEIENYENSWDYFD